MPCCTWHGRKIFAVLFKKKREKEERKHAHLKNRMVFVFFYFIVQAIKGISFVQISKIIDFNCLASFHWSMFDALNKKCNILLKQILFFSLFHLFTNINFQDYLYNVYFRDIETKKRWSTAGIMSKYKIQSAHKLTSKCCFRTAIFNFGMRFVCWISSENSINTHKSMKQTFFRHFFKQNISFFQNVALRYRWSFFLIFLLLSFWSFVTYK